MRTSKKGIDMIKKFEGLRLKSYKPFPHEVKWTIGYGHYGVKAGLKITKEEAEALLIKDLVIYEKQVIKYIPHYSFNQNEFDALVSFAYNLGTIRQLTADGTRSREVISSKMLLYINCGGKPVQGLLDRRLAERKLFLTKVPKTNLQLVD